MATARGEWVSETRPPEARTRRAPSAACMPKRICASLAAPPARTCSILRIPGIYAPDREGGTPRGRLLKGTPVLRAQDDVYTNHIHADDLARACLAALWRGKPQRVVQRQRRHADEDGRLLRPGGRPVWLPRPPRLARDTAQDELPLMLLSFMSESRRLDNTRLKRELRVQLRYPTVAEGLAAHKAP
jgi:nucleoside-diphosphate-sugar epimerase